WTQELDSEYFYVSSCRCNRKGSAARSCIIYRRQGFSSNVPSSVRSAPTSRSDIHNQCRSRIARHGSQHESAANVSAVGLYYPPNNPKRLAAANRKTTLRRERVRAGSNCARRERSAEA